MPGRLIGKEKHIQIADRTVSLMFEHCMSMWHVCSFKLVRLRGQLVSTSFQSSYGASFTP